VIKHASATEARFGTELGDREFALILEDNGKGFSVAPEAGEPSLTRSQDRIFGGHGLKNMSIRAQEAGGRLEITSQPGRGTRLVLRIPLPPLPANA
jgi:signal transduction histidine kinase